MFISREEYNQLVKEKQMNVELNKEVQRLAAAISANSKDCRVGIWCKDCTHCGYDRSKISEQPFGLAYPSYFTSIVDGKVIYCKKHLHEICPEHSKCQPQMSTCGGVIPVELNT